MANQLEARVAQKVGYVGLEAGKVVVEADDLQEIIRSDGHV